MIEMSTDYTQALKSIKDAEESSGKAIDERKRALAESLEKAHAESEAEIATAKLQAEGMVAEQIESARKVAEQDSKKIVDSTTTQAQLIARKKVSKAELKKIIEETLLSEFAGE